MLLHIDGEVVEIRPSELFESKNLVDSRYLELSNKPVGKKKVKSTKSPKVNIFKEENYGKSSSST
tara:strand:+ start:274 stop:468 length:195 start_codon:yes stop_codon:yes gene_type:complete